MSNISFEDFKKIDLRVGTIVEAKELPEARQPAYILHVDFGKELGIKKSSAQITDLYTPKNLVGKKVIAVVNFEPKQVGPIMSECLVTGFYNKNGEVVLASADMEIENGAKLV